MASNLGRAREAGVEEAEIRMAVDIARVVQAGAMKSMDGCLAGAATVKDANAGTAAKGCCG